MNYAKVQKWFQTENQDSLSLSTGCHTPLSLLHSSRPIRADVCIGLRLLPILLFLFTLLAIGQRSALGQTSTADIIGTVSDATGAVVPGASVTIVNTGTADTRTIKTNDVGAYVFPNLNPGTYDVTISAAGFSTAANKGIDVVAGDRRRVDVSMTVGASTTTVEVQTALSGVVQTDSSVVQSTLTTESVQNLPLNGRNYINLVQIVPGATEGENGGLNSGNAPDDRRQGSNVSINSQSDVMNDNLIDGMDNNERIIGTIGVRPNVDSIQEVKILTNNATPDAGRAAGAIVNVITKSGSNRFHGSAYEYFRSDRLNAFPFEFGATGVKKPELHQNQFGGSVGGPIWKDRTFFFVDAEGLRIVKGFSPSGATVPSGQETTSVLNVLAGTAAYADFSDDTTAPIYMPGTVTPFPLVNGKANQIPRSAFDSVGMDYFQLYPVTTPGASTVSSVGSISFNPGISYVGTQYSTSYDIRVDHKISDSNGIFVRYSNNSVLTYTPQSSLPNEKVAGVTINPQNGVNGTSPQSARNVQINYSHTFTPQLVMALGAGYLYINNQSVGPNQGVNPNNAFGEPGINIAGNPFTTDLGGVTFQNGFTGFGAGRPGFVPLNDRDNTYQINGSVFYNKGAHSIKLGSALIRRQALNQQDQDGMGNIQFADPGQLLVGNYATEARANSPFEQYYRTWEPSWYFNDDWHVNKKLTVNLGIRWDMYTPFVEKYNHIGNFNTTTGQIILAGVNGVSRAAGVNYDYKDFQPRVGFAYSVLPKTVVRGAFGMSYFPTNQSGPANLKVYPWALPYGTCTPSPTGAAAGTCPAAYQHLSQGLPVPLALTASGSVGQPTSPNCVAANNNPLNLPVTLTSGVCYPISIASSEPNYHDGYLEQYNLTVQREFGANVLTVSYVGSQGRHIGDSLTNINLAPPGSTSITSRAFYATAPNVSAIQALLSDGSSSYNALQAQAERRFTKGLSFVVSTTFAHALDNVPVESGGGSLYTASLAQHHILDYGNGDLDQRGRFVFQGNYAPKYGDSFRGIEAILLKGWRGSAIESWTTGLPFTPLNGSNVSQTAPGNTTGDRPNVNPLISPFSYSTAYPKVFHSGAVEYFNSGSFVAQTTGTIGNSRRGQLHGPHARHFDASITKDFPVFKEMNLNFRVEAFNVFNQTNFANPSTTVGPNLGYITATTYTYTPRLIQFAARFDF